jgi:hypothetical protein
MGPTACLDAVMKTLSLAMLRIKHRSSVFTVFRGGTASEDTTLQAGRSLVRLVRGSFRPHYGPGFDSARGVPPPPEDVCWVCRADKLTTFTCRLSGNLGTSEYWNTKNISGALDLGLYSDCRLEGWSVTLMEGYVF